MIEANTVHVMTACQYYDTNNMDTNVSHTCKHILYAEKE